MIIKSKARKTKTFGQLLNYLKQDKGRPGFDTNRIVLQNMSGDTIDSWVSQLENNEGHLRRVRKNATRVIHEILSFHAKDARHMPIEKILRIAKEYIWKRNKNGMFIAIPHLNDGHYHIHVAGSPWEKGSNKSLRLSKQEFATLKQEMEAFQQSNFPELTNSKVAHGKANLRE